MENIDFETVKQRDDGWKYLSEASPIFEEQVKHFLCEASNYVDVEKVNVDSTFVYGDAINYENFYIGSKKVALSYTSKPKNRDLDCQFKKFNRVEYYLDNDGNLVVDEISGRLESKYGYDFKSTDGGMLKTDYSYQIFSNEGIELLYRGYSDQFKLNHDQFGIADRNLRGCIKGGYSPCLQFFDGNVINVNIMSNNPRLIELSRSMDNLGLVREIICSFNNHLEVVDKKEEYHLNTFMNGKHDMNPYLFHINPGNPPIAYIKNNRLFVNYTDCGVTLDNYKSIAKFRFVTSASEKEKELQNELEQLSIHDNERYAIIRDLIYKYNTLYHIYQHDEKNKGTK